MPDGDYNYKRSGHFWHLEYILRFRYLQLSNQIARESHVSVIYMYIK